MPNFGFDWFRDRSITRIRDLTPDAMADIATSLLKQSGKNSTSWRLLYHALAVDSWQPEAILRLSDFLRDEFTERPPRGNGLLAGLLLERMVSGAATRALKPSEQNVVRQSREKIMALWGFSKAPSGPSDAALEFDELGYLRRITELLGKFGSFQLVFELAHAALGHQAGLLTLKPGKTLASFMGHEHFLKSPVYKEWLNSDASNLLRLKTLPTS